MLASSRRNLPLPLPSFGAGVTNQAMLSRGCALRAMTLSAIWGLPISACGTDPVAHHQGGAGVSGSVNSSVAGVSGSSAAGTATGGSSTAGSAGQAGSTSAGGSMAGSSQSNAGSAAGGSAGETAGGGASVLGGHCMGGAVLVYPDEVFSDFGGPMTNCNQYTPGAPGITAGTELSVRDIELATPLAAGEAYAFSIKVTTAPPDNSNTIELWSADDKCGAAKEKLYEGVMKVGILCVELAPTAGHTRLLMAWKGEGTRGSTDIAICPGGACAP